MRTTFIILVVALAAQPAMSAEAGGLLELTAEQQHDAQRRCLPGPHEPGRTRRLPGMPATSGHMGFYSRSVDAYPHCSGGGEAEADSRPGQGSWW